MNRYQLSRTIKTVITDGYDDGIRINVEKQYYDTVDKKNVSGVKTKFVLFQDYSEMSICEDTIVDATMFYNNLSVNATEDGVECFPALVLYDVKISDFIEWEHASLLIRKCLNEALLEIYAKDIDHGRNKIYVAADLSKKIDGNPEHTDVILHEIWLYTIDAMAKPDMFNLKDKIVGDTDNICLFASYVRRKYSRTWSEISKSVSKNIDDHFID